MLQLGLTVLILYAGQGAAVALLLLLGDLAAGQPAELVLPDFVFLLILGFYVWLAWQNIAAIRLRNEKWVRLALILLVGLGLLMIVISGFVLYSARERADINTAIASFVNGLIYGWVGLACLFGLMLLRRRKIEALDLPLESFLQQSQTLQLAAENSAPLPARDRGRGVLYALIGIGWIGITNSQQVGLFLFQMKAHSAALLLPYLGWFFLFKSRTCFRPRFEELIKTDRRNPIIFLRSFADDPSKLHLFTKARGSGILTDFSLEARLEEYFSHFGPFVAVGAPKRNAPVLGATRTYFADDEWQNAVLAWIRSASTIVYFAGTTEGASWELKQIIKEGQTGNLILFIPTREFAIRKRKDAAARREQLRLDFSGSVWENSVNAALNSSEVIRAMSFEPDGSVTAITSRLWDNTSYQLAGMVLHFLRLQSSALATHESVADVRHMKDAVSRILGKAE